MKSPHLGRALLRLLPVAGVAAALFIAPVLQACDSCQQAMALRLVTGDKPSAHAAEMMALIKNAEWDGKDRLLNAVATVKAGGTAAQAPAPATAPAPVARAFQDVVDRDKALGIWETSTMPQGATPDKKFTITLEEGDVFLGNGIVYSGFTVNDSIPGPTLICDEGDVIEFTAQNKGGIPHGVSIHAAYTQTSKYLGRIDAGQTKKFTFRANTPGVYMYHCAPGGHAIPMHTLNGQYGMIVVKPKTVKFKMDEVMGRGPDLEIYLLQHELYGSGKDAIEGRAAYVMFNGKLFRYVDSPIKARPGDFVRIYFLNAGPNLLSTFHLVGIIWDYAYWQGTPTEGNTFTGGQTVTAGPSDSWVIDFRVPPDDGAYLMVTHAFGSTTRGAIGILQAEKDAPRTGPILSDGPVFPAAEMDAIREKSVRTISPFRPGTEDLSNPFVLPQGQKKLRIQIIGNSYYPKVAVVPPGTEIEWVNEDVFAFFKGEFSGVHDVVTSEAPDHFSSPMLAHAERFSKVLTAKGKYSYYCTPHPYMEGVIIVE
ncbi:MAG: multicopper oxidase domain-containing protein [Candidatus Didemnitutus sp.]|nr:multicopper oxidase domain-containing protein [Candidatus Didemnitutus sp.]